MAVIKRMDITVNNGDNGTDGRVYLGLGGREFLLDRPGKNDFRKNQTERFVLGDANNVDSVKHPDRNDPHALLPIDSADLDRFPIYIRLDAPLAWHLEGVQVTVKSDDGTRTFAALPGNQNLFLGDDYGKILFLKPV